jgi:hypothetical protein
MRPIVVRIGFAGILGVLVTAGCDSGAGTLAPVHGKVIYHGSPLYTGTIVFTPDGLRGTTGALARADIRQDGTYDLMTGESRGAASGWYRVTIMAIAPPATGDPGSFAVPHSLLPEKYRDPELSGLSCQIRPDQENIIDFNLE